MDVPGNTGLIFAENDILVISAPGAAPKKLSCIFYKPGYTKHQ
jgi:hypothetical protein